MINFFTIPSGDIATGSIYYLGSIFGSVGTVLAGAGTPLLGQMFTVFNTAVLAIGTLIITYTTGVSLVLTAHEGEILGKEFHSVWVPLRTILGIAALVPTAGGYSYLQIALMWLIMQGVGAADTLWTATVNGINAVGLIPASSQQNSGTDSVIKMQMGVLFQDMACQAAEIGAGVPGASANNYLCSGSNPPGLCSAPPSITNTSASGTLNLGVEGSGECGTVTLGGSSPLGVAQNQALQAVMSSLGQVATTLVQMDANYALFLDNQAPASQAVAVKNYCAANSSSACTPAYFQANFPAPTANANNSVTAEGLYWTYGLEPTTGDFLTLNTVAYKGLMQAAMATQAVQNASPASSSLTDNGWIFAGAYFYTLAQNNAPVAVVTPPTVSQGSPTDPESKILMGVAQNIVSAIGTSASSAATPGAGKNITCSNSSAFGACDYLNDWISDLSNPGTNPVVSAQQFGTELLSGVEITYPILMGIDVGVSAIAGAIALGVATTGVTEAINTFILMPLFFFCGVFMAVGATLAVYTPLIPYMLFSFGAINWIIAVIETMIAAPIVAIGLLYPEGQHRLWGKAEAAINLLLNIFLRPSLMIFGMISGLLLSYVAINYINAAFMGVIVSISSSPGILEIIFFMIVYTTIFTTVLNKCFELIHVVPDRILRWIGGGQEQFGESGAAMEKVSQGFQAGAGETKQAAQGAATAAGQPGHSVAKDKMQQKAGQSGAGGGGAKGT